MLLFPDSVVNIHHDAECFSSPIGRQNSVGTRVDDGWTGGPSWASFSPPTHVEDTMRQRDEDAYKGPHLHPRPYALARNAP